ncbi:nucleoside triphosphate pyrophosphohydrolase [Alphaproteobacteria bacterium]|nr:nucleoside triphosphate pyrophosphohydrolase [Alphaproteobacteria bacterium]|tara:strand:+ start:660 stop:1433 length:774 start_codon:yes stop_codon:yes gene_type:complete
MVKKHKKLSDLVDVVKRLRNPKNGCPWDIQQTSKSLAKYTLEEAYEVIEAIESNNYRELEGELGDLLLQVIYHSIIAAEKKKFSIEDVIDTSVKKMKSRHPHIFMRDESIKTVQDVNEFWETQKKYERKKKGAQSVLDGVSVSLPAVTRSLKLQKRAAKEGFDWKDANGNLKKVKEELNELSHEIKAQNKKKIKEELGDLLFSCINLSRKLGLDTETVIRDSNRKFEKRFKKMEKQMNKKKLEWNLKNLEKQWQNSK